MIAQTKGIQAAYDELLQFIYLCPFGLAEVDRQGEIISLNAMGSQVLYPIAVHAGLGLHNILHIIARYAPELKREVEGYQEEVGTICSNRRICAKIDTPQGEVITFFLSFTIIRFQENRYQYAFKEVNNIVEIEKREREALEQHALEMGKLELATGILHDIGNAITAFGSQVAKLSPNKPWEEISSLHKLEKLLQAKEESMNQALGPGKGQALIKYVSALHQGVNRRFEIQRNASKVMSQTTSHIQEILNIQRHYVRGSEQGERTPVKVWNMFEHAFSILDKSFVKRDIQIAKDIPLDLPQINGDHTKLIQVLINIMKNSAEAYDAVPDKARKTFEVTAQKYNSEEGNFIELIFKDQAIGFDEAQGKTLFEKGVTYKDNGTGLGLYNCKKIIEIHGGSIRMESEGIGLGATTYILLPHL